MAENIWNFVSPEFRKHPTLSITDNLTINLGKLSTNDHHTQTKGPAFELSVYRTRKIIDNIEKLKNTHTNHHCILIDRGDYILYMLQCRVFFTARRLALADAPYKQTRNKNL